MTLRQRIGAADPYGIEAQRKAAKSRTVRQDPRLMALLARRVPVSTRYRD